MRILLITLCFLLMSSLTYAGEFFVNSDIKDLRITTINTDEGSAVLKDLSGNVVHIGIGDTIGAEGGTVISISQSFITIQDGDTNTRIPVKRVVGKSARP